MWVNPHNGWCRDCFLSCGRQRPDTETLGRFPVQIRESYANFNQVSGLRVTAGAIIPISPFENSPSMTRAIAGIDSGIEEVPRPVEGEGSERLCGVEARRAQHPGDQFGDGLRSQNRA